MSALTQAAYRWGLSLLAPLLPLYLAARARNGKEIRQRLGERYGHAGLIRPQGILVWIHAASVGESMSVLPLVNRLCELNPEINILFTSGTVASAELISQRLPARAFHQFIPLDVPRYARRFVSHWRPDAAIWLESELWPNLLDELKKHKIPAIRLNARLTAKSAAGWNKVADWFGEMLSVFALTLAIGPDDAQRLKTAGARNVQYVGNLKFTAPSPAVDETPLNALRDSISHRPVWLMASSHPGEEEMALRVHAELVKTWTSLLTIIAPRHPRRGDEIEKLITLPHARRSRGDVLKPEDAVYLADTMGEMPTLYRAAGLVVMGGSFTPKGGHNPIEPAQCGAATLIGPDTAKCDDIVAELVSANALRKISGEAELIRALTSLLRDTAMRQRMQEAGLVATRQQERIMNATLGTMAQVLGPLGIKTA